MKKIVTSVLALVMVFSMTVPAMAVDITEAGGSNSVPVPLTVEAATFSVTVPTQLPITVDTNGNVVTATDAKIVNHSHGSVKITDVAVEGQGGWVTVDFDSAEMHKEKVGSKKVALEINNAKTTGENTIDFASGNFPKLDGENDTGTDELPVSYSAKLPAQANTLTDVNVVDIIFTISWDE